VRDWVHAHAHAHGAHRERGTHWQEPVASDPIWLPQPAEPVNVILASGEKLPARALQRTRELLVVAIVVPVRRLGERELGSLVLEYSNPGGRVRLRGRVSQQSSPQGVLLRFDSPQLIDVVQQRRHVRVAAECPVALRRSGVQEPFLTHTIDLSAGGLLLAQAGRLLVPDEVDVTLAITPGTAPVTGVAEVVRVDDIARAAVHFTTITPADRWRLIRFTVDCQSGEAFRHPALDEDDLENGSWQRSR